MANDGAEDEVDETCTFCCIFPIPRWNTQHRNDVLEEVIVPRSAVICPKDFGSIRAERSYGLGGKATYDSEIPKSQIGEALLSFEEECSTVKDEITSKENQPLHDDFVDAKEKTASGDALNRKDLFAKILERTVAIDCGMVDLTFDSGKKRKKKKKNVFPAEKLEDMGIALRRVCVVDGYGSTLLNETVRVPPVSVSIQEDEDHVYSSPVVRHLFHMLPRVNSCGDDLNVGIDPKEARGRAASLLKDKFVVGHSVSNDLFAVGLQGKLDPAKLRDTALYPPFLLPNGKPHRLKYLARIHLERHIQEEGKFHCCLEDALASLDLYKSFWQEWEEWLSTSPNTSPKAISQSLPNAAPGSSCKLKRKKKKQKKRKKVTQNTLVKVEDSHESKKPVDCSHFSMVWFVISWPVRMIQDICRLTLEASLRFLRVGKQYIGFESAGPPARLCVAKSNRKFWRKMILWADHSALVVFVAIELHFSVAEPLELLAKIQDILMSQESIAEERKDEVPDIDHCGVFAAAVALGLFTSKHRYTLQSRLCYGALSYYLASMRCVKSGNLLWKIVINYQGINFQDISTKLELWQDALRDWGKNTDPHHILCGTLLALRACLVAWFAIRCIL